MIFRKQKTDEELLLLISRDDHKALEILFNRYYQALCFFSNRFLNNKYLVEEAVSDVFLNIWLKRGRIQITSSIKAYLYTAVRNQSINYLKKKDYNFEDLEVVDKEKVIASLSPDHFIYHEELKNEIEKIILNIPEKRQIIFRMNRIDGLSYKEIAEVLSISVNTVQNQMGHAVKYLAEHLPRIKKFFILLLASLLR
ncbi:MAG TPA: RNA polymerase sigma-70 factor [Melioribacteraceae bacterium]|nr:RNA polymerase sigma-70 factor [Melioribacteraceae bacterium]